MLINTAGFLQSKSQQTGEESSAQVTNQLQVVSKTGVVTEGVGSAQNTLNRLVLDSGNGEGIIVNRDDGTGVTFATGNLNYAGTGDGTFNDGNGNTLQMASGGSAVETTVTVLNSTAYEVSNTNGNLVVNLAQGDSLSTASSDFTFNGAGFPQTSSDVVVTSSGISDAEQIDVVAQQVTLRDSTSEITILDGGSFSVESTDGDITLADGDSNKLDLSTSTGAVSLDVSVTRNTGTPQYTLTGPDGNQLTVDSGDTLQLDTSGNSAILRNGGNEIQFTGGGTGNSLGNPTSYVLADNAGQNPRVTEINLVVLRGAGAGDIDMSGTIISFTAPDGSHTLTFNEDAAQEDDTFTITAVQDEDNTAPVLSSGDRFELTINPGTLSSGATAELRITTQSGATKVVQVRIPDSLANKEAVNL